MNETAHQDKIDHSFVKPQSGPYQASSKTPSMSATNFHAARASENTNGASVFLLFPFITRTPGPFATGHPTPNLQIGIAKEDEFTLATSKAKPNSRVKKSLPVPTLWNGVDIRWDSLPWAPGSPISRDDPQSPAPRRLRIKPLWVSSGRGGRFPSYQKHPEDSLRTPG